MNSLNYLKRLGSERELDNLIIKEFKMVFSHDGEKCTKCGVIQGKPLKGFRKYYCKHLSKKIDRKLKKEKEKITEKILGLNFPITSQDTVEIG